MTEDANGERNIKRRTVLKGAAAASAAGFVGVPALSGGAVADAHTSNMTVRSDTGTQVTGYRAGDEDGDFPTETPDEAADLTWVPDAWSGTDYDFDPVAQWIWHCDEESDTGQTVDGESTYYVKEPIAGDVVEFENNFSIPGTPTEGTLYITADNGYEVFVNGNRVGSAQVFDTEETDWEDSDLEETYVNNVVGSWKSVEDYDVGSDLTSGDNTLTVLGANEQKSPEDTVTSNPGGVIYELDVTYETCEECDEGEDALAKYEFECEEYDEEECVNYDFILEGDGDDNISYEIDRDDPNYENKEGEEDEPVSVTFETDYCELYAFVKAGREEHCVEADVEGGVATVDISGDSDFMNPNNGKQYAISYVEFYCECPE